MYRLLCNGGHLGLYVMSCCVIWIDLDVLEIRCFVHYSYFTFCGINVAAEVAVSPLYCMSPCQGIDLINVAGGSEKRIFMFVLTHAR